MLLEVRQERRPVVVQDVDSVGRVRLQTCPGIPLPEDVSMRALTFLQILQHLVCLIVTDESTQRQRRVVSESNIVYYESYSFRFDVRQEALDLCYWMKEVQSPNRDHTPLRLPDRETRQLSDYLASIHIGRYCRVIEARRVRVTSTEAVIYHNGTSITSLAICSKWRSTTHDTHDGSRCVPAFSRSSDRLQYSSLPGRLTLSTRWSDASYHRRISHTQLLRSRDSMGMVVCKFL